MYKLFEIPDITYVEQIFNKKGLRGFNVTIPYKQSIKRYLDVLDISAVKVGAVNVVKIDEQKRKVGYNSDYYGFKKSLAHWIGPECRQLKALILGTGGASRAVKAVFNDLDIPFLLVSRSDKGDLSYDDLGQKAHLLEEYRLLVNTTPLGMSPKFDESPRLPYDRITSDHFLYDLIYNPPETRFLKLGIEKGAKIKNGHEMLVLQAEKSWEIWNEKA